MNTTKINTLLVLLAVALLAGCAGLRTPDLTDLGDGTMRISSSPLQWQLERSSYFNNWDEASAYVATLELGGHSDWRLPTSEELLDLYFVFDFGNAGKNDKLKKIEGFYWVAEKNGTGYLGSWQDTESCEITRQFNPGTRGGYVMAVRS
jgi:hypothetical protein